jgi:hypothetical protein
MDARRQKTYPPSQYDARLLINWYQNVKSSCECPACTKWLYQTHQEYNVNIEFHHIDPRSKCDTLSNMVWSRAPLGSVMAEMLKVMPLCHSHHVDFHRLEAKHHQHDMTRKYDFNRDDHYRTAIREFHQDAWDMAPRPIQDAYVDWETNARGIFVANDNRAPGGQRLTA